ncbi:MAG: hypothetical protein FWE18_02095 [Alphaproteobacteria bacterium]|nr:hypothetical protein [Alphaproteobacteria bacterium]
MARKIEDIRKRRYKEGLSSESPAEPVQNVPEQPVEAPKKSSRFNLLNIFRRKPKEKESLENSEQKSKKQKVKKSLKRELSDGGHFKIIPFIVYIIIFLGSIAALAVYIFDRESLYETKNKRLFTVTTTPAAHTETQNAAPLIEQAPIIEQSAAAPIESVIPNSAISDIATFRLVDVTPRNLGTTRLPFADFLSFIGSNRSDFCRYAETARMAFILANNELRDYSSNPTFPVNNKLMDYNNCMNSSVWSETELFNLYNNLFDDFLSTSTQDDVLLRKLNAAKSFNLHVNFNPVRDMPEAFKNSFLSESSFTQLFRGNYMNQILFCNYSNMFAKAYDQFVSKRVGSLKPVANCLSDFVNNQEAYTQYVFYFNFIQPNSKDPNVIALQSALIPNNEN